MNKSRTIICRTIEQIVPCDAREAFDRERTIAWVQSGVPLWRAQAVEMHLVSYFVLYDASCESVLLIDHKKAGLWLPAGGHVEPDETPREAVEREIVEELGIEASFATQCADLPFFITMTRTHGRSPHTDVSLWYVVAGDSRQELEYEHESLRGYRWLTLAEARAMPAHEVDPEFFRFMGKFSGLVEAVVC